MSSQAPYQNTITLTLDALGWSWMHVRPVYDSRAKRWLTPTTTEGWADVSAFHNRTGIALYAELKGYHRLKTKTWKTSDLRPGQLEWLHRYHRNPGCAAVVFRPDDDWHLITGWLHEPMTLLSGYGWLPPEDWRAVVSMADPEVTAIIRSRTDSALSSLRARPER